MKKKITENFKSIKGIDVIYTFSSKYIINRLLLVFKFSYKNCEWYTMEADTEELIEREYSINENTFKLTQSLSGDSLTTTIIGDTSLKKSIGVSTDYQSIHVNNINNVFDSYEISVARLTSGITDRYSQLFNNTVRNDDVVNDGPYYNMKFGDFKWVTGVFTPPRIVVDPVGHLDFKKGSSFEFKYKKMCITYFGYGYSAKYSSLQELENKPIQEIKDKTCEQISKSIANPSTQSGFDLAPNITFMIGKKGGTGKFPDGDCALVSVLPINSFYISLPIDNFSLLPKLHINNNLERYYSCNNINDVRVKYNPANSGVNFPLPGTYYTTCKDRKITNHDDNLPDPTKYLGEGAVSTMTISQRMYMEFIFNQLEKYLNINFTKVSEDYKIYSFQIENSIPFKSKSKNCKSDEMFFHDYYSYDETLLGKLKIDFENYICNISFSLPGKKTISFKLYHYLHRTNIYFEFERNDSDETNFIKDFYKGLKTIFINKEDPKRKEYLLGLDENLIKMDLFSAKHDSMPLGKDIIATHFYYKDEHLCIDFSYNDN
jgi:hypothetical protein